MCVSVLNAVWPELSIFVESDAVLTGMQNLKATEKKAIFLHLNQLKPQKCYGGLSESHIMDIWTVALLNQKVVYVVAILS